MIRAVGTDRTFCHVAKTSVIWLGGDQDPRIENP